MRENNHINNIKLELQPLKKQLKNHKLYKSLKNIENIKTFMEYHVFAVWDFMSIVKALQINLTTVQTPWIPASNAAISRFINEIVFSEESDINELNEPKSHFEMYLDAMGEVNADTKNIINLVDNIRLGDPIEYALKKIQVNKIVAKFVNFSFSIINTNKTHLIASAFTFGRETIIPDMFIQIVNIADPKNKQYKKLKYYLERHIEIDGDEHGPIALQMIEELCNNNEQKWSETLTIAKKSIAMRIQLWDAIYESIRKENEKIYTLIDY